ncbi:YscK family type III secretion system sorting platform protein [Allochromatium palmeri]|uniref:YscK family type III secretion system sorting platform protein n=2 Tax=Allochromatium palmeri TaxID=231048 RepID=A0A6N8EHF3_9GAMM|nr:YscK family type III secretion system sorting platform protein [Allochromatium palmeri]
MRFWTVRASSRRSIRRDRLGQALPSCWRCCWPRRWARRRISGGGCVTRAAYRRRPPMVDACLGLPGSPWCERALILNTQPTRYLHASWYEALPHRELARRLMACARAEAALSRYLLQSFELEGRYVENFSNPWARLALLDGPWIERLMRRLGLALHASRLRLELSGERLRRLKSALSAEDWNFMMRETPLLGPIPVFHSEPHRPDADPATRFALIGTRFCVLQGLGALDEALIRRLALKLPADWTPALSAARVPQSNALPPILRRLLRELPPAWIPLFA